MKSIVSLTILFLCLVVPAAAQDVLGAAQVLPPDEAGALDRINRSPRHAEWVTIDAGGGDKVDLWVVYPERSEKAPVVLLIHEIFGLNDWARAVADSLAAEGFIAVAPDFLSGKGPGGRGSSSMAVDQARAVNSSLDAEEVFRRLDAASKYATALPAATRNFAVIGFCWGGGMSFAYASRQPSLKAAVVYYGTSPSSEALAGVRVPVLGLYGGNDARVNATVGPAAEEMKRLGKSYEIETYAGAGHGFLRQQSGQNGANLKAAQAAWPKTVEFLKRRLEGAEVSVSGPAAARVLASFEQVECCDDEDHLH